MNIQTIQFNSVSARQTGVAITAKLWLGTTLAGTLASITEDATLDGQYTGTVTDVDAGTYKVDDRANGYSIDDPSQQQRVTLVAATGTYVATRAAVLDSTLQAQIDAIKSKTDQLTFTTNNQLDVSIHSVSQSGFSDIFETYTLTESYPASGVEGTPAQTMYLIQQGFLDFTKDGASIIINKLDGTQAAIYSLDSATTPTLRTRSL